jgi:hypothetical protein
MPVRKEILNIKLQLRIIGTVGNAVKIPPFIRAFGSNFIP